MNRLFVFTFACMALAATGSAGAQEKVKMRIGTHISISAHLFMQRKPEVLKNLGKTYEVEWVRFAGSGDATPVILRLRMLSLPEACAPPARSRPAGSSSPPPW